MLQDRPPDGSAGDRCSDLLRLPAPANCEGNRLGRMRTFGLAFSLPALGHFSTELRGLRDVRFPIETQLRTEPVVRSCQEHCPCLEASTLRMEKQPGIALVL